MACNRWKRMSWVALVFAAHGAFAGEAWLVISSDSPGAAVSVNGIYRGATPQRPEDTLRVKVAEGVCEVSARLQISGNKYAKRQTITAIGNEETVVRFHWDQESPPVSVTATPIQPAIDKPEIRPYFPTDGIDVPGRNF